jgi:hypothetical protein
MTMIRTIVGIIGLFTSMVAALGLVPAFALSHYQIGYNDGCAGRTVPGSHVSISSHIARGSHFSAP